ncbi:hypothetical protein [Clostridium sp.]|jgi:D-hexose-6-phosphate mutarotase|uniref:hypothetical protein n=1 Tax=Clostridium sp. TaxID=1506 RepID=UPI002FDE6940
MENFDTSNAKFNGEVRKLEITDPCHADTFNAIFNILVNNDVALNKKIEEDIKRELSSIQADTTDLVFQLAMQNLLNTSNMKHVFVDKIESNNDVNLLQGMYGGGKVYI